ncbi:flagellar FliJ family protein [Euzebya rosea]|uniref:flagellar FliJ family protein n=1 Tax=Euzebya rosea TaxID=2052804 RepID=UPI000D3E28CF|nr:flagellar FliJ family protein [Euzebya rosea]
MKRFAFRLSRVQRVREIERDRARGEWARARAQQTAAEQQLQTLRADAAAEANGLGTGTVMTTADVRAAAFRASLRARAAEMATMELARAREATEARAAELLAANTAVDALDKLEQRHRETWEADARRHEAAVLDDVATTRSARVPEGRR